MKSLSLILALLLVSLPVSANTDPDAPWTYKSLKDGVERAGWIYDVSNKKSAAVFVYYARSKKQWYLMFSYISTEEMVHLEDVIVKKEYKDPPVSITLDIGNCKGKSCITNDKTRSGLERSQALIPVHPSTIEHIKSGNIIRFRYKTPWDVANNDMKGFNLSLKGSRKAIERFRLSGSKNGGGGVVSGQGSAVSGY